MILPVSGQLNSSSLSVRLTTTTAAIDPLLLVYLPNKGGNTGTVTVTITGTNLDPNAEVKLTKIGESDIVATSVTGLSDGTRLTATFDLTSKTPGVWNMVTTNPGGQSASLPDAFTIEFSGEAKLWVEIIGKDQIRVGREQIFIITYGNSGNVDAEGVPIWIAGIPRNATVNFDFKVTAPPLLGEQGIDWSRVPILFETDNEKVLPLFILRIPAGTTKSIRISLTVPTTQTFYLRTWINPPSFGSSPHPEVIECGSAIVSVILDAIGFVPGFNCGHQVSLLIADLYNQSLALATQATAGENVTLSLMQLFASAVFTAADCIVESDPLGLIIMAIPKGMKMGLDIQIAEDECTKARRKKAEDSKQEKVVTSIDPNDKSAPGGFDLPGTPADQRQRFTAGNHPLGYTVFFENLETATAAVQDMSVTDQLDSNLDWSSFSFDTIQIGTHTISVPQGSQNFGIDVDFRPEMAAIVQVSCTFDPQTWYCSMVL